MESCVGGKVFEFLSHSLVGIWNNVTQPPNENVDINMEDKPVVAFQLDWWLPLQ